MEAALFDIPVAFVIFNRPATTEQVFKVIAQIKPKDLFIIADGPRNDAEAVRCKQAREVIERVDWECNIHRNYSDINLGCKQRLNTGLTWLFEQSERAIILEDDCLPDPSFFPYCKELLERYEHNEEVMIISGDKVHVALDAGKDSYYFSYFNHIWGWASWRRVWEKHDQNMTTWNTLEKRKFLGEFLFNDAGAITFWETRFGKAHDGLINTWDYQVNFSCWINRGFTIIPAKNLVKNIGMKDEFATHYADTDEGYESEYSQMEFPLRHPIKIQRHEENDRKEMTIFHRLSFLENTGRFLRAIGLEPIQIRKMAKRFFK